MPRNDRLFQLLAGLDDPELASLWVDSLGRKPAQDEYDQQTRDERIASVSKAWRAEHGNALLNVVRGPHDLAWKQILVDVADRLSPGLRGSPYKVGDAHTEPALELAVLQLYDDRLGPIWEQLTPEQRAKASAGVLPKDTGVLTVLANGVSALVADRSLAATLRLLTLHEQRRLLQALPCH